MIGLTDTQLKIVMNAARALPVEEHFFCNASPPCWHSAVAADSPTLTADVAQLAMAGLIQQADVE